MDDRITLEEFVEQEKRRLDMFLKLAKQDPSLPEKLNPGDWDEQYSMWMEQ
jgi:hypothetical protein